MILQLQEVSKEVIIGYSVQASNRRLGLQFSVLAALRKLAVNMDWKWKAYIWKDNSGITLRRSEGRGGRRILSNKRAGVESDRAYYTVRNDEAKGKKKDGWYKEDEGHATMSLSTTEKDALDIRFDHPLTPAQRPTKKTAKKTDVPVPVPEVAPANSSLRDLVDRATPKELGEACVEIAFKIRKLLEQAA